MLISLHRSRLRTAPAMCQLMALGMLMLTSGCISMNRLSLSSEDGKNEPFSAALSLGGDTQIAYRYIPKNMRTDEKITGVIMLERKRGGDTQTLFEIRKMPGGYAAEAQLYQTRISKVEEMKANFSISADKEHDLMAGFRFRWKF